MDSYHYLLLPRAKDYKAKAIVKSEIKKLKPKVRAVNAEIAELSSEIRAREKIPSGSGSRWQTR